MGDPEQDDDDLFGLDDFIPVLPDLALQDSGDYNLSNMSPFITGRIEAEVGR